MTLLGYDYRVKRRVYGKKVATPFHFLVIWGDCRDLVTFFVKIFLIGERVVVMRVGFNSGFNCY